MAQHNILGHWGEQKAAEYLRKQGLYIRHTDWRHGHCDLDIVAIDEEMTQLIIVEVKTRSTAVFGEPDIAITLEKKNNIIKSTAAYMREFRLEYLPVRYDTISIIGSSDENYTLTHKEDAFGVIDRYQFYEQKRKRRKYRNGFF